MANILSNCSLDATGIVHLDDEEIAGVHSSVDVIIVAAPSSLALFCTTAYYLDGVSQSKRTQHERRVGSNRRSHCVP